MEAGDGFIGGVRRCVFDALDAFDSRCAPCPCILKGFEGSGARAAVGVGFNAIELVIVRLAVKGGIGVSDVYPFVAPCAHDVKVIAIVKAIAFGNDKHC